MESSNLKSLVNDLLAPIEQDAWSVLQKVLPPQYVQMYLKVKALGNNPMISAMLPAEFKNVLNFDPASIVQMIVGKIQDMPPQFWLQIEEILQGVIEGDPEAIERAKSLLGVNSNESTNQA